MKIEHIALVISLIALVLSVFNSCHDSVQDSASLGLLERQDMLLNYTVGGFESLLYIEIAENEVYYNLTQRVERLENNTNII